MGSNVFGPVSFDIREGVVGFFKAILSGVLLEKR
jgi:hypothetical protein